MVVIDRRNDQGAYAPGANRAQVQTQLEKDRFRYEEGIVLESTAVPAPVEMEDMMTRQNSGVACITETPGSDALVRVLMSRIWGC
jgi:hypothetical protein